MSSSRSRRRRRAFLEVWGIRSLDRLVAHLSYGSVQRLAAGLGRALAALPGPRRLIRANLGLAFPDWSAARVNEVLKETAASTILVYLEALWFFHHREELLAHVDVEAVEYREVLARVRSGSGTLVVTPHLGNWELGGLILGANGIRVCAIARRVRNPWLNERANAVRAQYGMEVIPARGVAVRGMVKALRAGKVVATLMDQNTKLHRGGVFVDFFGLPVPTTRAPAAIARRLGVQVLCAACVRAGGLFRIQVAELPRPVTDYGTDEELTQALLAANEQLIRRYPGQYLWNYERWRQVPESAPADVKARYPYYARE